MPVAVKRHRVLLVGVLRVVSQRRRWKGRQEQESDEEKGKAHVPGLG